VIEAAERTAMEKITGHKLTSIINFLPVEDFENSTRIAELDFNGSKIKVILCHGINKLTKFINKIQSRILN
jgi:hypothetical protein